MNNVLSFSLLCRNVGIMCIDESGLLSRVKICNIGHDDDCAIATRCWLISHVADVSRTDGRG